jgi:(p)ppGpp synthase/HD superfamily hydrolase
MSYCLQKAINLSLNEHQEQYDKNGVLYFYHPIRVCLMAEQLGLDEEAQSIGVLHDIVEDTEITLEYLHQHFSSRIVSGVDALTRRNKKNAIKETFINYIMGHWDDRIIEESYFDFVRRASENSDARKIKMLDNADNMRPERLKPRKFSLPERYRHSLSILKNACIVAGEEDFVRKFEKLVTWI